MSAWIERLAEVEEKYQNITRLLAAPETLADPRRISRYSKELSDLTPLVTAYRRYRKIADDLAQTEEMLKAERDPAMAAMAREEKDLLAGELPALEERLRVLLLPKDPNDGKNVFLEIRAGTGGEEAGLFVADLARMYTRYAERRGWKLEMMSGSPTELGGYKEVVFLVKGEDAYRRLKYEGGVHRVQRIPATEAGGRIHTSAVSVAVMPEADEVDFAVRNEDIQIDVFRSGGCGGQSVNTTDSAVRLTHKPTGIVVSMQDERSQLHNRIKAMRVLRARLKQKMDEEQRVREEGMRRSMVGSGDRSERIRTYNYPQGRLTDHRINLTLYRLQTLLDGDLDEVTDALVAHHQAELLHEVEVA
jgi:peptide chain release factor 1